MAARKKYLKILEIIRDGRIYWQTATKMPDDMFAALGFTEAGDGFSEVERPDCVGELGEFSKSLEIFGFLVKITPKQQVVAAATLEGVALSSGEAVLGNYNARKEEQAAAEAATAEARDELQSWLVEHGVPKDPFHNEARVVQLGSYKVHNSWVRGRVTKWDDRDHEPVSGWAAEKGVADELVGVVIHKTVPYKEFLLNGVPDGYEKTFKLSSQDLYNYYVCAGAVPHEVHNAFEARGKGYYSVKVYETNELSCDNCGHKVTKTQKFCSECGTKR